MMSLKKYLNSIRRVRFVLGEGGGCLIFEDLNHAMKRMRNGCELAGGGLSVDAYHMTAPHPTEMGRKW